MPAFFSPLQRFAACNFALPALLAAMALFALAIRVSISQHAPYRSDEAFSLRVVDYSLSEQLQRTAADVHPPLHYFVLTGWRRLPAVGELSPRFLSNLLGVLGILVGCLVCRLALQASPESRRATFFAALLLALSPLQVEQACLLRMYSQGILLTTVSSCFLLLALHSAPGRAAWWAAYGFAVAALCLTHYYGLFTALAQGLFAVAVALRRWAGGSFGKAAAVLGGLLLAVLVAGLLFVPWLPAFLQQVREVQQDYWIAALSGREVAALLSRWAMGMKFPGWLALLGWLTPLLTLALWRLIRGDAAAWFFALQAALPWLLSLAWSAWTNRPIVVERYLAFAQVGWLGLLAVLYVRLPGSRWRLLLAVWTLSPGIAVLAEMLAEPPRGPVARVAVMQELARQRRAGESVFVSGPAELTIWHLSVRQAGLSPVRLRCLVELSERPRHVSHLAALRTEEVDLTAVSASSCGSRCWWAAMEESPVQGIPPGLRAVWQQTFNGRDGRFVLIRFERVP